MSTTSAVYPTSSSLAAATGWTNPANAYTENDSDATTTNTSWYTAWSKFATGVNSLYSLLPAGSTVSNIELDAKGYVYGAMLINGDSATLSVQLSVDGGLSYGTARTYVYSPYYDTYTNLWMSTPLSGAPSAYWGLTLNVDNRESFTDANFRMKARCSRFRGGITELNIDVFKIVLTYTGGEVVVIAVEDNVIFFCGD